MKQTDLLLALRDCYDPVSGRNIVELNLVRSAALVPDSEAPGANIPGVPDRFRAEVVLAAPGSDESINAGLIAQIESRLAGIFEISQVHVELLPPIFLILNARRE